MSEARRPADDAHDWSRARRRHRAVGTRARLRRKSGIADTELSEAEEHLQRWLAAGRHGDMAYMARHGTARARPAELVPGTVRVITARMNYWPAGAARRAGRARRRRARLRRRATRSAATITRCCARGLRGSSSASATRSATSAIACSPTARRCSKSRWPRRRASAGAASTRCCSRATMGSYFFLGEIYTDLPLPVTPGDVRALRHLRGVHRRVSRPAPSSRPTSSTRAAASPISRSSIAGAIPEDAASADRQPRLRLRRLPARVPVEPVRADGERSTISARCATDSTARRWSSSSPGPRTSSTRAWPAARSAASATSAGCATSPSDSATRRASEAVVAALESRADGSVAARARARRVGARPSACGRSLAARRTHCVRKATIFALVVALAGLEAARCPANARACRRRRARTGADSP